MTLFIDGNGPGCSCGPECEMPCWQRVGLTEDACCKACSPLPAVERDEAAERRADAIAALYIHAFEKWGWSTNEYADVEAAVDVVLQALASGPDR